VRIVLASGNAHKARELGRQLDGEAVGEIASAGYSPLAGTCVALGYVRGAGANRPHDGTPARIELWGEKVDVRLYDRWPKPAPR